MLHMNQRPEGPEGCLAFKRTKTMMKKGLVAVLVFSALLCIFSTPVTAQFAGIDMPGGKRSSIFDMALKREADTTRDQIRDYCTRCSNACTSRMEADELLKRRRR